MPFVLTLLILFAGCSRSPEKRYADFMANGKKYLEAKDYARAIIEFKNASQTNPKSPEPYYQLSLASIATQDLRSAVGFLRRTTDLDPKHKDAQLKLAELLTVSRNKEVLEDAAKRVQEVLADSPNDPDALSTLAAAEWKLGKREEAEDHLEQAFRNAPQNLRSSISLARLRLARKDVQGAEEVLKKAVQADPKSVYAVLVLGSLYTLTGRPVDAEKQFQQALKIDAKNGLALVSLAGTKLRAGLKDEAEQLYKQAAAGSEPQFRPIYAIYLYRSGRQKEAITEFERLAHSDPADRQARTRLVGAYLATERPGDAEKVLQIALQKNPKDADALLQRSQIHLSARKWTEAQADLNQVLKLAPDSAPAHHLMARVYQGRGQVHQQRQELGEAVRLAPDLLAARLDLAQHLIATNQARNALTLLNEAPASQRNLPMVLLHLNWANLALGNLPEAASGVQRALEIARTPDTLVQNAVLRMMQKDYSAARQSAEEALKASPENVNALKLLAQSFAAQKQTQAAVQRLKIHAGQNPKSPVVHLFLGEQMLRAGDRVEARKAFEASKALKADYTAAELSLAQLDVNEGKPDAARSRLSRLISSPDTEIAARQLLAAVEERSANYLEAVEHYRAILARDENNLIALNNLAYMLAEYAKQPDEALKFAEKAKALRPERAEILDTLGWIYYRKGLYPSAVENLEQAVAREETPVRKGHLGLAYFKSGQVDKGRKLVAEAIAMDPRLKDSRFFQTALAEMR